MIATRHVFVVLLACLLSACTVQRPKLETPSWNDPIRWRINTNDKSRHALFQEPDGPDAGALRLEYTLGGDHGWIELSHPVQEVVGEEVPIVLRLRAEGTGQLEFKLVDNDGSTFGTRMPLAPEMKDWARYVIYPYNTEYWWGGADDALSGLAQFQVAVSSKGSGTVWMDVQGPGKPGTPSALPVAGPVLDPDRELPGIGFRQRRAAAMIPEDPLILEWLKVVQDTSSPERQLLPSMENNECQTFNNALVAMAFMVKGERERAERILDFFAAATKRDNEDSTLQNFFYKGEARGFFQAVNLVDDGRVKAYHTFQPNDRWMGDMAWLLLAYKHHEQLYGPERYATIRTLLLDLLKSWYVKSPDGPGGYVGHGWRAGDSRLHEGFGHAEGNIDAYAVFRLCGENELAGEVRTWLDRVLRGNGMPLDLYTWRALAYGPEFVHLLDIPDYDLRYRKILEVNGKPVMGLFYQADINATNSWFDGVGHIACAYIAGGNRERGWFYGNQLDPFIIERDIGGVRTHAIPYMAHAGNDDWVKTDKGFISVAAWYIFAKNGFNPMTLRTH